jgi:hypothetical protein
LKPFGLRLAGLTSLSSSAIAAAAVALLLAMYLAFGLGALSAGQRFGAMNDALTLLAYILALPGVLATAAILPRGRPRLVGLGATVAIAAIVAIGVLQWQLITGALTFGQQIGPVSVAFLALGAWFILSGYLGPAIFHTASEPGSSPRSTSAIRCWRIASDGSC